MMFFAAVHEPAFGMKRRFVVLHQFGGYWKHSGTFGKRRGRADAT
jgi:hypothetical protein